MPSHYCRKLPNCLRPYTAGIVRGGPAGGFQKQVLRSRSAHLETSGTVLQLQVAHRVSTVKMTSIPGSTVVGYRTFCHGVPTF
jgi:hypothetical protein